MASEASNRPISRTKLGLGVTCIVFVIVCLRIGNEPSYKGRAVDHWIWSLRQSTTTNVLVAPVNSEPRIAIRYFGTNAVPYLLENYAPIDSYLVRIIGRVAAKYDPPLPYRLRRLAISPEGRFIQSFEGFSCLGDQATSAIPALSNRLFTAKFQNWTAMALGFIGPDAIPTLFQGLFHRNLLVRSGAATGIQLLSPAGDPVVAELLSELGLKWNSNNSWAERSVFHLTGESRAHDCWEIPAYPELDLVIKNKPLNEISNAVNKVLTDFDPAKILASQAYGSTAAFLKLVEEGEKFINGTASLNQMASFFESLDQAQSVYPERAYSIEMLRLEILLERRPDDQHESLIGYLQENAGTSPIRWRDLAWVLVERGGTSRIQDEAAIEAAEKAISLTEKPSFHLLKLATDAYGGSEIPRKTELEEKLRGRFWPSPFSISPAQPSSK